MAEKYMEKFDSKDSDSELKCITCCQGFRTVQLYKQHVSSSKHFKRLMKIKALQKLGNDPKNIPVEDPLDSGNGEKLYCCVCDKTMYGIVSYMAHIEGSGHAKKLKLKQQDEDTANGMEADKPSWDRCEVCNKSFNGPVPFNNHLNSSIHEKELQRVKDGIFLATHPEIVSVKSVCNLDSDDETVKKDYYQNGKHSSACKLCRKFFTGPESAKEHIQSKKHINALEMKKLLLAQLKDKENGSPAIDQKSSEILENENAQHDTTKNGENNEVPTGTKPKDTKKFQDDFEFL